MSNDALDRLKKRQRPSVPSRDISIQDRVPDTSIARYLESEVFTKPPLDELKTKQSTIRPESAISERLQEVCRANGLSREVLIEALFNHYESDPETWQAILAEVKQKAEYRQKIANYRGAQSMMQQFES